MKTDPDNQNPEEVDRLLAQQPIEPSADFVDKTISRIQANEDEHDEWDEQIDAFLAKQPIETVSNKISDNVLASFKEEQSEKEKDTIIGFPSWVVTIGTFAASLIIGMLAFIYLFNQGVQNRTQTIADNQLSIEPVIISEESKTEIIAQSTVSDEELMELEELLIMDEALNELLAVDEEIWDTLALLED